MQRAGKERGEMRVSDNARDEPGKRGARKDKVRIGRMETGDWKNGKKRTIAERAWTGWQAE